MLNKALTIAKASNKYTAIPQENRLTTVDTISLREDPRKSGITTAFNYAINLQSLTMRVKPTNNYGETYKSARLRIAEHKKLLSKEGEQNAKLVEHAMASEHNVQWRSAGIVVKEQNWKKHNLTRTVSIGS